MFKKQILIIAFTLTFIQGFSQPICFERTYDTLGSYYANCVKQTFDNGYITCGSGFHAGFLQDAVAIKLDSLGNVEWTWSYSTGATDGATHVVQLQDSSFVIYGFSTFQGSKMFLAKLSNSGNMLWTKEYYMGAGSMTPSHMIFTSDSGFAVTGSLLIGAIQVIYLTKLNSTGDSLWTVYYNYLPVQHCEMIIECLDKGFLISGEGSRTTGPTNFDVYAIKTDSIGDTLWTKTYSRTPINNRESGEGSIQLSDSIYYITGYSWNLDNNSYDIFLLKLNQSGDTSWTKLIGDSLENSSTCIQLTTDSLLIICGTTTIPGSLIQAYLVKLNLDGDTIWTKSYGGNAVDIFYWIECTRDFGFVASGSCESSDVSTGPGIYIIKTDSSGKNLTNIFSIVNPSNKFEVFPNPIIATSYLICKKGEEQLDYNVLIYDVLGRVSKKYFWNASMKLELKHDDLISGIYVLAIFDKNSLVYTKKIVIN